HDGGDLGDVEMRMRVDDLDPFAADEDLAPFRRGALGPRQASLRDEAARGRSRNRLHEVTTSAHSRLLSMGHAQRPIPKAWELEVGGWEFTQCVAAAAGKVKSMSVSDAPPPQLGLPPGTYTACPSLTA